MSSTRISDDILAGAIAGAAARLVTAPFDVLKIRFQLQFADKVKYTSMAQAFATVIKEEGLVGLWKGNISATYLWISYAMVQFGTYGFLRQTFDHIPDPFISKINANCALFDDPTTCRKATALDDKPKQGRAWKAFLLFLAGAGAGISATSATYPFDIMRTQFAIQGKEKAFTSMHSFITHTFRTQGVKGFYAGLSPAVVGIAPYMGLNFAIYESVKAFSESPIFSFNRPRATIDHDERSALSSIGGNENRGHVARAIGSIFRKGACGAIAGGVSKFIVYPLVRHTHPT